MGESGRHHIPERLEVCGFSDKGCVRPNNEDYFGYYIPADIELKQKRGSMFAVSDGVGGSPAGEAASAEAVNVLLQEYYFGKLSEKIPDRLKNAFQCTALHIYTLSISDASARNMKCTLTTLLLKQNQFFITHVGDSKVLLLRDSRIFQLTNDHNMAGKLLRLGLISADDARNHPDKNILLRAVGESPFLVPDFRYGTLQPGDLFCLVTDGIMEHASAEEIQAFLLEKSPSQERLTQLTAELNRRGGCDNMTILAVKVNGIPC
jgi:protein phosphatase